MLKRFAGMAGERVSLSGETVSDSVTDPTDASALLTIDSDGNVYKQEGSAGQVVQIDSATDWVRPANNTAAYQVRFTNLVGTALTSSTAAEDAWHAISDGDFTLQMERSVAGTSTATFDVQIRRGTGTTLASTSYTLTADVSP